MSPTALRGAEQAVDMARAPARLKQIQLRLDETLSLSRGLENHLNPELPHAHESALTHLRRRDPPTTGTHDAQPLQPLDRSKKTSKPRRSNARYAADRETDPDVSEPRVRLGVPLVLGPAFAGRSGCPATLCLTSWWRRAA